MEESSNPPNCLQSAIKFISGATEHVCRLCFGTPTDDSQETFLEDIVTISRFYYYGTTTFHDLFNEIGISLEEDLPQMICMNCSLTVINAFLFHKFCQYSDEKWSQAVNSLSVCVPPTQMVTESKKSACLFVNIETPTTVPYIISSKNLNVCDHKNVSKEINKIISNRKQAILNKAKIKTKRHILSATNHQCHKCDKLFASPFSLKDHIERVHDPKILKCLKCNKCFSTKRQLKVHHKHYHETATCNICDIKFPNKYEWSVHWDKHKTRVCRNCNRSFNNRHTFGAHKKVCSFRPKYTCHHCGKSYCNKDVLRLHIREHGFGKLHTCKWCKKQFCAISRLKEHIVKHTKEKNFGCDICGGSFVSRASLIYHRRLHTGEKPYTCDMCEEKFVSSSRRLTHMRVKHFAPTNICNICQAKFTSSVQLRKHISRHYNRQSRLYKPELDTDFGLENI